MEFIYKIFNGRLAQFAAWKNEPEGWEARWSNRSLKSLLESHASGKLGEFEIFSHYLPKDLPVLEAGCGLGQLVMALSARGYQVEGVDYAEQTIHRIKTVAPTLNVKVGDVYSLDNCSGTLGGYISLGVFEHNPDGPLPGLLEVHRVLHKNGVAFISVPYLNNKRQKLLQQCSVAEHIVLNNSLRFYQSYFAKEDFESLLNKARLKVIDIYPYAVYAGLTRDFDLGRRLHERGFFFWQLHKRILRWCENAPRWVRLRFAHMIMFICRPLD
jgi:SAM-dependent methyltransferase